MNWSRDYQMDLCGNDLRIDKVMLIIENCGEGEGSEKNKILEGLKYQENHIYV